MKKRHVYLWASAINLMGMGMMMAAGANSWGLIAGAVVLSLGAGQRTAIYFSMQADPVDYGVWKTGINTAGILTSINGFFGESGDGRRGCDHRRAALFRRLYR